MENYSYATFPSSCNPFTIVWTGTDSNLLIQRIFLSDSRITSEVKTQETFKNIKRKSSTFIERLGEKIQEFLKGEIVEFDLDLVNFNKCTEVQRKVLIAEFNIPRGWISTYNRIANKIGIQNGARVVGNALAKNPFPIIIPCHRAIKTNGDLGGYQGGIKMKRTLLEMEGIKFSNTGKVIDARIYY
ncbi:MAG: methylated-DNA--[protein]-cysteine S-methyltransferase [Promethearchaeota archaeon]|nr:MAG: methylated-DNA--[protein]-cysteine S-methyltransferase [Candidatus Lokiarchaeota archaeon]